MELSGLFSALGGGLWVIVFFVIALSIIVAIHEYGHYVVGRWSGIHAEVFSLGFGPVLFSRFDRHGTKWQVAALPLGGYVKFLGDANAASAGTDPDIMTQLSVEERRRTMSGAPLWARAVTVAAGPVFNFILSILIFTGLILWQGTPSDPLRIRNMIALPVTNELQPGDTLLAVNGHAFPGRADGAAMQTLIKTLPAEVGLTYTVLRDEREVNVIGPYIVPPLVDRVQPRSAAYDAGIREGDFILSVDGKPLVRFEDLRLIVETSAGAPLALEVWKDGETRSVELIAKATDEPQVEGGFRTVYRVGIIGSGLLFFEPEVEPVALVTAFQNGVKWLGNVLWGSLSGIWYMLTGKISSCNLSGVVGIAETAGAMADQGGGDFLRMVAVLSAAIGMLNLFPIPMLDGGHLVFYGYEAIRRRPPSEAVMRVLMTAGLVVVMSLMIFGLINDTVRC